MRSRTCLLALLLSTIAASPGLSGQEPGRREILLQNLAPSLRNE